MSAPIWLKIGVGGLCQVSPNRAAKLAHRFFRRPGLTCGYSSADLRRLEVAKTVLSQGDRLVTEIDGRKVTSYHFAAKTAATGTVLLLHGWSGDSRTMAAFPKALTRAGYDVVAIDLPAHGDSDGVETDLIDAADMVAEYLVKTGVAPDHIIAHSFGGAVATRLADLSVTPRSATSIAAPTNFALVLAEVSSAFGLSEQAEALFTAEVARITTADPTKLDALTIWSDKPTQLLILHSPADERVAFQHATHLAQAPNARLQAMDGLDHCEIVYAPQTVAAALGLIQSVDAGRLGATNRPPEVA